MARKKKSDHSIFFKATQSSRLGRIEEMSLDHKEGKKKHSIPPKNTSQVNNSGERTEPNKSFPRGKNGRSYHYSAQGTGFYYHSLALEKEITNTFLLS